MWKMSNHNDFKNPEKNLYSSHPDWSYKDVYTAAGLYTQREKVWERRRPSGTFTALRRLAATGLHKINGGLLNCGLLNQIVPNKTKFILIISCNAFYINLIKGYFHGPSFE